MPITMLYAGALGLLFLVVSYRVIQARNETKVFLGDGGNELMIRRMRGQANFAEYVPFAVLLLALLESRDTAAWLLHTLGGVLLASRVLHAYAFSFSKHSPPARFVGTLLTFVVVGVAGVLCIGRGLSA